MFLSYASIQGCVFEDVDDLDIEQRREYRKNRQRHLKGMLFISSFYESNYLYFRPQKKSLTFGKKIYEMWLIEF